MGHAGPAVPGGSASARAGGMRGDGLHQGLRRARARRHRLAGGKGANLGELTRAGLPVPPGFVLTTAAYRAFVAENGLDQRIRARPLPAGRTRTSRVRAAAERIRALFAGRIPAEIAGELREATAATAGLRPRRRRGADVAGRGALLGHRRGPGRAPASPASRTPTSTSAAPTRCSTRSATAGRRCGPRAPWPTGPARASTRPRSAWPWSSSEMVDADAAGVMFTANPTNGRRDEVVHQRRLGARRGGGRRRGEHRRPRGRQGDGPRCCPADRGQGGA